MIVVADTSPLNYLVLVDRIEVLSDLYREVLLPEEVRTELRSPDAPGKVRAWASALPPWCRVVPLRKPLVSSLSRLDAGEAQAIQLALERNLRFVLMDDAEGRAKARSAGLHVTGTLGALKRAADANLLDFHEALRILSATNFRMSHAMRASLAEDLLH